MRRPSFFSLHLGEEFYFRTDADRILLTNVSLYCKMKAQNDNL
jgi:hypothetical protein